MLLNKLHILVARFTQTLGSALTRFSKQPNCVRENSNTYFSNWFITHQGLKLRLIRSPMQLTFYSLATKNLVAKVATGFLYDLDLN